MPTSLDYIYDDAESVLTGYRDSARLASIKASGGGGMSMASVEESLAAVAGPAGGSLFGGQGSLRSAARQYAAASKDYPYTAIRPVAVKIADLAVRAGLKKRMSAIPNELIPKSFCPEIPDNFFLTKELSKRVARSGPPNIKAMSEGISVLESHTLMEVLENPNPYFTQWALMYCTAFSMEATGRAVWVLDPVGGREGLASGNFRIWYYPSSWITPVHGEDRPFTGWKLTPPGVAADLGTIPAELVVHFFYPDPGNPLSPHSPVQSQSNAINTDDQIQQAQLASMRNAIKPGMVIIAGEMDKLPGQSGPADRIELTPEQRKQIITAVRLAYRGVVHFNDPIILDRLIKDVKPYMQAPADLDFPSGSQLTKGRIMQGIGTNPIIAGQNEGANRAVAYVAQDNHYAQKVNPLGTCMSQTMTASFSPIFSPPSQKIYFWIEEAKPHDADLQLQQVETLGSFGLVTGNEVRELFDLPPHPELNELVEPPGSMADDEIGAGGGSGGSGGGNSDDRKKPPAATQPSGRTGSGQSARDRRRGRGGSRRDRKRRMAATAGA